MSGPLKISQHPQAATANNTDELVANQDGTTVKLTVGQVRATLAPAVHTHGEADIIGTIAPSRLAQAGASAGQVLKWNGAAWAPATDAVGTGGTTEWSALTGMPAAIDAIDNLTPAADRVAYYTGANTAALTIVTGFARTLLDDEDATAARGTLGAAAAVHGHAIADVTNLQAALDGKANATHTHSEADISGTIAPSKLGQAGASAGQVLKWNGSAWAPAAEATGGGAGGYASQRTITASGTITDADRNGVIYIDGAGITATLVRTGFSPRDRVLLINIGSHAATISAATDGFNTAGNNSFILFPGEEREVVYEGSASPYWRVAVPVTVELAANQVATLNSAGTGFEARTEKEVWSVFLPISGNVAGGAAGGQIGMWGDKPCRLTAVRARTLGGTCSIQIRKDGLAIDGFAAAIPQTTVVTGTPSSEVLAQDNVLDVVVTSASGLTGLFITFLGVRTAE